MTETEAYEWLAATRGRAIEARVARKLTVEEYARRWLGEFVDTAVDIDEVTPAEIAMLSSSSAPLRMRTWRTGPSDPEGAVRDAVDERLIARSPVPASRRTGSS